MSVNSGLENPQNIVIYLNRDNFSKHLTMHIFDIDVSIIDILKYQ